MGNKLYFIAAFVFTLAGCISNRIVFPLDENGPVYIASKHEICANRKILANFDSGSPLLPSLRGGIILDGTIANANILPNERQEIIVSINKILLSDGSIFSEKIAIVSPLENNGGIRVIIGEKYRIFTVKLKQKYYTWAANGTAPLSSIFGACTEN